VHENSRTLKSIITAKYLSRTVLHLDRPAELPSKPEIIHKKKKISHISGDMCPLKGFTMP
jgi:hypothetical protein